MIRKDFDEAIKASDDFDAFIDRIKGKYQIRFGYSGKWQSEYFTVLSKELGMERPRRNYALGSAYTVNSIKDRIRYKNIPERFPVNTVMIGVTKMAQIKMKREEPVYTKKQRRMLHYHWRLRKIQRGGISVREFNKEMKESRELLSDLEYSFVIRNVDPFSAEDVRRKRSLQLKNVRTKIKETEERLKSFQEEIERQRLEAEKFQRISGAEKALEETVDTEMRKHIEDQLFDLQELLEGFDPGGKEYLQFKLQELQKEELQIKAELYRLNRLIEVKRSQKEKADDEVQHRPDKQVR